MSPEEFCNLHSACSEGKAFALKYNTMKEVWNNCPNPNWMLWIVNKLKLQPDQKALRLFACYCVRYTPINDTQRLWYLLKDPRSKRAVLIAERFANSKATREELSEARAAAAYAADAAAAYAAYAAAAAAYATAAYATAAYATAAADAAAAYATAAADAAAAYATAAADAAAYAADAYAARDKARMFQANRLRKVIANPFT